MRSEEVTIRRALDMTPDGSETAEPPREHLLKVIPPYFDSLVAGSKTFEVRRNDRAYQRGDVLRLREWHPHYTTSTNHCPEPGCNVWDSKPGHWAEAHEVVLRKVTFVFVGDPRFGGVEPGYVVLGLGKCDRPLAPVAAVSAPPEESQK